MIPELRGLKIAAAAGSKYIIIKKIISICGVFFMLESFCTVLEIFFYYYYLRVVIFCLSGRYIADVMYY